LRLKDRLIKSREEGDGKGMLKIERKGDREEKWKVEGHGEGEGGD
jgi:hypothetical protein